MEEDDGIGASRSTTEEKSQARAITPVMSSTSSQTEQEFSENTQELEYVNLRDKATNLQQALDILKSGKLDHRYDFDALALLRGHPSKKLIRALIFEYSSLYAARNKLIQQKGVENSWFLQRKIYEEHIRLIKSANVIAKSNYYSEIIEPRYYEVNWVWDRIEMPKSQELKLLEQASAKLKTPNASGLYIVDLITDKETRALLDYVRKTQENYTVKTGGLSALNSPIFRGKLDEYIRNLKKELHPDRSNISLRDLLQPFTPGLPPGNSSNVGGSTAASSSTNRSEQNLEADLERNPQEPLTISQSIPKDIFKNFETKK